MSRPAAKPKHCLSALVGYDTDRRLLGVTLTPKIRSIPAIVRFLGYDPLPASSGLEHASARVCFLQGPAVVIFGEDVALFFAGMWQVKQAVWAAASRGVDARSTIIFAEAPDACVGVFLAVLRHDSDESAGTFFASSGGCAV